MATDLDKETLSWLGWLANTNEARKAIIKDLLRWASRDRMSAEDRLVCKRGLELIAAGKVPEASGPRHIDYEELVEV